MYSLAQDLEQGVNALREAAVDFEIVGGVAASAHVLPLHRSRSFVTREIEVLMRRDARERAAKTIASLDLAEAVHLLFVGEKSKSTQPLPRPELDPEEKDFLGIAVPVAPLRDLLQMKLNSFRPKDLVHLEILDKPDVEG
jgi:hypothetical protein